MDQRARLGRGHQLFEDRALALQALVERQVRRRFDRVDRAQRRFLAARAFLDGAAVLGEERRIAARVGEFVVAVADATASGAARGGALGEADGAVEQVALDDLVDDAERLGLRRAHEIAGGDHVERGFGADEARQSLRAAGARQ